MRYVEMTIEEAMKRCNKNDKVLVAIKDLENDSVQIEKRPQLEGRNVTLFLGPQ